MTRDGALKKRAQFERVYELGSTRIDKFLVMKAVANNLTFNRLGFSVNKKIGKAVVRNHIKRLLKEITRLTSIKLGFDIVFIARADASNADYHQLKKSVNKLLSQANLLLSGDENISS